MGLEQCLIRGCINLLHCIDENNTIAASDGGGGGGAGGVVEEGAHFSLPWEALSALDSFDVIDEYIKFKDKNDASFKGLVEDWVKVRASLINPTSGQGPVGAMRKRKASGLSAA